MYKQLLIFKYLRKRRIAWVSLIAVTLCTAMVIVVISVMGGWLRMFRESFHGLTGDVIVHGESLTGFPHYEEMIERIRKLPNVKAAVPTIETFGLINISNLSRRGVQVIGYPADEIAQVNNFTKSLYRQHLEPLELANDMTNDLTPDERARLRDEAARGAEKPSFKPFLPPEVYSRIKPNVKNVENWPGMITGVGVVGITKGRDGSVPPRAGLYTHWVNLTVLPISPDRAATDLGQKDERPYWIVDDSRTQIWQADQANVYVPFDVLQRSLSMDGREEIDPQTNAKRQVPARTRDIQVAAKPGADLYAVKADVQKIVLDVIEVRKIERHFPISVETWEESQATFIGAIEKEKALVTILFGMISIVAVFLIFCIFYMIVVEKTRDIGIIKSVGATNLGVAGIFLGYGMAIGIVGAGLGLLAGWGVVHNINFLHDQMGKLLGVQIWNPEVYAFDIIPNTMNPKEVAVILAVAMVSAVLGAMVPAYRAARMHPVDALRWE